MIKMVNPLVALRCKSFRKLWFQAVESIGFGVDEKGKPGAVIIFLKDKSSIPLQITNVGKMAVDLKEG
jgi:hypothetical protein